MAVFVLYNSGEFITFSSQGLLLVRQEDGCGAMTNRQRIRECDLVEGSWAPAEGHLLLVETQRNVPVLLSMNPFDRTNGVVAVTVLRSERPVWISLRKSGLN